MEEEYRRRLFLMRSRLLDWLDYLEKLIAAERMGLLFFRKSTGTMKCGSASH